ncbi:GlcG/HbpS family heme-binding protein [Kineosporia babensis]|uniref:Heme-binding protein n=1 Tax=Kineosporia babensis TaxID=499548 RepID=A0A9X1SW86_9ACTN|nr:heme-binding protein [Kineosporia babensis]MCD5314787.1 heme-binding protein [Kineosporia babensis]
MLTLEQVERVMGAATVAAEAAGVAMNIAVLDEAAQLKAFVRMDGALLGSIDVALGKARTSALFRMNTEAVFEFCKPGGPSFGLENTNGGLVVFAGGCPLIDEAGTVIGAIGVSGGSPDQDGEVALNAAKTLL